MDLLTWGKFSSDAGGVIEGVVGTFRAGPGRREGVLGLALLLCGMEFCVAEVLLPLVGAGAGLVLSMSSFLLCLGFMYVLCIKVIGYNRKRRQAEKRYSTVTLG